MDIPGEVEGDAVNLFHNGGLKLKYLRNDELFLAVYQENGKLSLLHTISKQMKTPVCSQCSRRPCPCLASFKKKNENEDTGSNNAGSSPVQEDRDNEENDVPWTKPILHRHPMDHYQDPVPLHQWYQDYGCNLTPIIAPPKRDILRIKDWSDQMTGVGPLLPENMHATFKEGMYCERHNNLFVENDPIKTSDSIIIFSSTCEKVFDIETYGRGTGGKCKCIYQLDGDPYLLWHIGKGRFIEYTYLNLYLNRHLASGHC